MSQKAEKYARGVERGLSGLEERLVRMEAGQADQVKHLACLETGQADQVELILTVLRERTAAEETAKRRIHCVRQRAAEAERRADLWKAVAFGAVMAFVLLCIALILLAPATGTAAAEEGANTGHFGGLNKMVLQEAAAEAEAAEPEVRVIQDCVVSYYCCERYPHICGTGDGITATGTAARPWVTCAVDPSLIPLGSTVTVDFGGGETVECVAEDVGQWVQGEHVDICVSGHQEALELGLQKAEVRWTEGGGRNDEGQDRGHDRGGDPGV